MSHLQEQKILASNLVAQSPVPAVSSKEAAMMVELVSGVMHDLTLFCIRMHGL